MKISDRGASIEDVVTAVKNAIKFTGMSSVNSDRDLRVVAIQLTLNTVATLTVGCGVEFRIPFIGMNLKVGDSVTRRDTHTIDMTLVPPDFQSQHEVRDSEIETVLLNGIETMRAVITRAAYGDDPFFFEAGAVELRFAVTHEGYITLGFNGELRDEIFHTLRISLETPPK